MACGVLYKQPDYVLDKFIPPHDVSPLLDDWLAGGWKQQALILCGAPGLGKTELGCALIHSVVGSYHFVNKLDRLRDATFGPGQGLVVDEVCLATKDIDDVKALLVGLSKRILGVHTMSTTLYSLRIAWGIICPFEK